ncbi:MAG: TIGR02266 family protein [Deltaproteobacteria bacterium]|nr:TIGR02266 family protein [Deltaproteobacteria bacterium]
MDEKRRGERVPVELKVGYRTIGAFITDYIINISKGGIFINTTKPLPVGTKIRILFSIPDIPLPFDLLGIVRWINPVGHSSHSVPGMGIEFLEMEENVKKRIEKFINQQLKKDR